MAVIILPQRPRGVGKQEKIACLVRTLQKAVEVAGHRMAKQGRTEAAVAERLTGHPSAKVLPDRVIMAEQTTRGISPEEEAALAV